VGLAYYNVIAKFFVFSPDDSRPKTLAPEFFRIVLHFSSCGPPKPRPRHESASPAQHWCKHHRGTSTNTNPTTRFPTLCFIAGSSRNGVPSSNLLKIHRILLTISKAVCFHFWVARWGAGPWFDGLLPGLPLSTALALLDSLPCNDHWGAGPGFDGLLPGLSWSAGGRRGAHINHCLPPSVITYHLIFARFGLGEWGGRRGATIARYHLRCVLSLSPPPVLSLSPPLLFSSLLFSSPHFLHTRRRRRRWR
jgi:hypothetical protein